MKEVLKALRPVKHRIRRNRFLRGAAAGLAAGLAAAVILQAVSFFVPVPDRGLWAAAAAAAVMLLTALGNAARPVKDMTAAQAADACGLKERTVTALEGGDEPIRQLLIRPGHLFGRALGILGFPGSVVFLLGLAGARLFLVFGPDDLDIDEFVAGDDKGVGGLFLAHPDHVFARLPKADGKSCKVGIGAHEHESVAVSGIEDIHGVDDHGGIRGILSGGIPVLLHRGNGVFQQRLLPAADVGAGPVAVDSLQGWRSVNGDLLNGRLQTVPGNVVRVDQHGETQIILIRQSNTPLFRCVKQYTTTFLFGQ